MKQNRSKPALQKHLPTASLKRPPIPKKKKVLFFQFQNKRCSKVIVWSVSETFLLQKMIILWDPDSLQLQIKVKITLFFKIHSLCYVQIIHLQQCVWANSNKLWKRYPWTSCANVTVKMYPIAQCNNSNLTNHLIGANNNLKVELKFLLL